MGLLGKQKSPFWFLNYFLLTLDPILYQKGQIVIYILVFQIKNTGGLAAEEIQKEGDQMSIGMHHVVRIAVPAILLITGIVLFVVMSFKKKTVIGVGILLITFFLYGYGGHKLTYSVPVKCPKCSGKAYAKQSPKGSLYYECTECGHVEKTGWVESDGNY